MLGFKSGVCVGGGGGAQVLNRCKKNLVSFCIVYNQKKGNGKLQLTTKIAVRIEHSF